MQSLPFLLCLMQGIAMAAGDAQRMENDSKVMLVFIVTDASSYVLPQFLGTIDRLRHPKEKTTLWIRSDKAAEETLNEWLGKVENFYSKVDYGVLSQPEGVEADGEFVLTLKQEALLAARELRLEYALFIDADVLIKNVDLIDYLIDASVIRKSLVTAPLIAVEGHRYSNFWGDISDQGGYVNSEDYDRIGQRVIKGCFHVPLVHSVFLLNMDILSADIQFNSSVYQQNNTNAYHSLAGFFRSIAAQEGIVVVCNHLTFGEMSLPVSWLPGGASEKKKYLNKVLRRLAVQSEPILPSSYIQRGYSHLSADFDMVYIINLKRRQGRRAFMEHVMYELGIEHYQFFDAVDGMLLNDSYLESLHVKVMEDYEEPITQRRHLTNGEIGCFLSHYFIWQDALDRGYKSVLILEDDASPVDDMLNQYNLLRQDLRLLDGDWDLLYLGRKLHSEEGSSYYIEGLSYLVRPAYSYWMVAYALTNRGLRKVMAQKPLSKMVPTDEYIPILYDKHPNETWKDHFQPRDLVALAAQPRLIYPSHYPGDTSYLSDTEYIAPAPVHDEL